MEMRELFAMVSTIKPLSQKVVLRQLETKTLIAGAAAELFSTRGYLATSIDDIAEAARISKGKVYYYFKSKRDLMISILKFIRVWARKNIFIHAYNTELCPTDRMKNLLEVLRNIHIKGYAGCIFSNTALETANNDDEFVPILREYFNNWKEALKAIYRERYHKNESEERAERFFSELNGVILSF